MKKQQALVLIAAALSLALTAMGAWAAGEEKDFGPQLDANADYYVTLHTTMGKVVGHLFTDKAPRTSRNFINLAEGTRPWRDDKSAGKWVRKPLYDGLTFHRVIPNFMIQGGDPRGNGSGGPGYKFEDEFDASLRHDRPGLWSMANSGKNTNGSQFFITERPTPHLDDKHSVFGETLEGQDICAKIARVQTTDDRPSVPVVIQRCEIIRVKKGSDPKSKPWEKPELILKKADAAPAVPAPAAASKDAAAKDRPTAKPAAKPADTATSPSKKAAK